FLDAFRSQCFELLDDRFGVHAAAPDVRGASRRLVCSTHRTRISRAVHGQAGVLVDCIAVLPGRAVFRKLAGRLDISFCILHFSFDIALSLATGRIRMSAYRVPSRSDADGAIAWLLEGDPSIRWQTLRDLVGAAEGRVERERRKVAREGWGASLLAR